MHVLCNTFMLTSFIITLILAAILILSMAVPVATLVDGQQQQQLLQHEDTITTTKRTFRSITDGFRAQVPNGWVVEDINRTDRSVQEFLNKYGVEFLAFMCPRNQSFPDVGGLYSCPFTSPTAVGVEFFRFVDLDAKPELAVLARENKSITTSDLMALFFEYERKNVDPYLFQKFEIVNNTDITLNVIDPVTNQTVETVPGKYIEWIHTDTLGTATLKEFTLFALSNDTNTGYVVHPIIIEGLESNSEAPPSFVRQVLDSFELLAQQLQHI